MKALIALLFINVLNSALGEHIAALDQWADVVLSSQAKLSKALRYNIHYFGKFTKSAGIGSLKATLTCTNGRVGDYATLVRFGPTNLIRNRPRNWINATIPVKIMAPLIAFDRCSVGNIKRTSSVSFTVDHHIFKFNLGYDSLSKVCKVITSLIDLKGIKLKAPSFSIIETQIIQQLLNWFKARIIKDINQLANDQLKRLPFSVCRHLATL